MPIHLANVVVMTSEIRTYFPYVGIVRGQQHGFGVRHGFGNAKLLLAHDLSPPMYLTVRRACRSHDTAFVRLEEIQHTEERSLSWPVAPMAIGAFCVPYGKRTRT